MEKYQFRVLSTPDIYSLDYCQVQIKYRLSSVILRNVSRKALMLNRIILSYDTKDNFLLKPSYSCLNIVWLKHIFLFSSYLPCRKYHECTISHRFTFLELNIRLLVFFFLTYYVHKTTLVIYKYIHDKIIKSRFSNLVSQKRPTIQMSSKFQCDNDMKSNKVVVYIDMNSKNT